MRPTSNPDYEIRRASGSRGQRRRFTQCGCPVSPASISAAAGRDASRWSRKGGTEPSGHSAVCCFGCCTRRRHRWLRRRDAGSRCWVGPGRLRGGEPERGVQAVHDRCARRSPRARRRAMSKPRPVCWPPQPKRLISRGWLEPGAYLALEATSGEPAGRSLSPASFRYRRGDRRIWRPVPDIQRAEDARRLCVGGRAPLRRHDRPLSWSALRREQVQAKDCQGGRTAYRLISAGEAGVKVRL